MGLTALVQIILVLIVLGVVWWLVETYIPIAQPIKLIIYAVIAIFAIVFLLNLIGINVLGGVHG